MENQSPKLPVPEVSQTPNAETPPASQTPKPGEKFKLSAKAIISTIIFLLLAGGAAAGYVYIEPIMSLVSKPTPTPKLISETPEPTSATKKTFSSKTEGFTLEYPSTWRVSDTSDSNCGHTVLEKSDCRERFTLQSDGIVAINFVIHKDQNDDTISCGTQAVCVAQKVTKIDYLYKGAPDEIMIVTTEDKAVYLHKPLSEETTPKIGSNLFKDYMIDFSLPSKTGGRYVVWIRPPVNQEMTFEEYFNIERVKEAMIVLSTFKFTNSEQDSTDKQANVYIGNGFVLTLPPEYTSSRISKTETQFKSLSGFGLASLKSQSIPFPEPKSQKDLNGEIEVKKTSIAIDGKQTFKYYIMNSPAETQSSTSEKIYFNVNNTFYELNLRIDAGGLMVDTFTKGFKFTN